MIRQCMQIAIFAALCVAIYGCGASKPASGPEEPAADADEPAASEKRPPAPPRAERKPVELETHGHVRVDPYYWMRDRENEDVIRYLEEENAYLREVMADTDDLQDRIFEEIRARIREDDSSVPYRRGDYYYYRREEQGNDYPIYARKKGSLDAPEEVILDVNELAADHDYYDIRGMAVSDDHSVLAFAADTVGRRIATIYFVDLETGEMLDDEIPEVTGNLAWAADDRTIFYARQDPETLRSFQIYRYELGGDPDDAKLVFEEEDPTFRTWVSRTRSRDYLLIASHHTTASEYRYLRADDPGGQWEVILPRERGHEYSVEHAGESFYIRTNDEAQNFRLVRAPVGDARRERWEEVVPHRSEVYLESVLTFRDHVVVGEREDGLVTFRILPRGGGDERVITFDESAYTASPGQNAEFDTGTFRLEYTSLTTPTSVYDYDVETGERELKKRDEVLGGFDPDDYRTERLYATARDGTSVPISLVYREDLCDGGPQPLLLYAYGSYGASVDASFSSLRLSLLDRGFAYAIAHVRGGQELGRGWYDDGKLLNKKNTFYDFIDASEHLVSEGFTEPSQLYALGGSAGGLLIGAVINERPDLYHGVIAAVPFVDIVTTMLDDSIPLTTNEYDEWGNPNEREYYEYMLSYSPYDQVRNQDYPHMLVTSGLHDSQVQFWEPTKWVAKLRHEKTGDSRLLLRTHMEAGHGGASGRYRRWRDRALEYAFLLDLAGLGDAEPRGPTGRAVD